MDGQDTAPVRCCSEVLHGHDPVSRPWTGLAGNPQGHAGSPPVFVFWGHHSKWPQTGQLKTTQMYVPTDLQSGSRRWWRQHGGAVPCPSGSLQSGDSSCCSLPVDVSLQPPPSPGLVPFSVGLRPPLLRMLVFGFRALRKPNDVTLDPYLNCIYQVLTPARVTFSCSWR